MSQRHNKLSVTIAGLCSGALLSLPVSAQPQREDSPGMEEVVVTGIYRSVKTSMDQKRNSDIVSDGVASEELGKFPDQNVAESLQRITGVSIDRDGGEGRSVTVRGFGPEFNAVLYNGRVLATESAGREFSFDVLAADVINGANVYKSNSADILSGGIGSTINLSTAKPMDQAGLRTAFTVKGTYDTLAESENPYLSGVVSWSNDRWGALLSANHQTRDYREDQVSTDGWMEVQPGWENADDVTFTGEGDPAAPLRMPRSLALISDRGERTRTGGTAVVQFKPQDNMTLTADALYSKFEVDSGGLRTGAWTQDWALYEEGRVEKSAWDTVNIDQNQTVTGWQLKQAWDSLREDGSVDNPRYSTPGGSTVFQKVDRPTETTQFGFNAEWHLSDAVTLEYDVSVSEAENTAGGRDRYVIAVDNAASHRVDFNAGRQPVFEFGPGIEPIYDDPSEGAYEELENPWRIRDLASHQMYLEGSSKKDEIQQHRFDVDWSLNAGILSGIEAGAYLSSREQSYTAMKTRDDWEVASGAFSGGPVDLPDDLFTHVDSGDFLSGGYPDFYAIDPDALITYLNSDEAIDQLDNAEAIKAERDGRFAGSPEGIFTPIPQLGTSWSVEEDIAEVYLQANLSGRVGGLDWSGNIGARYAETDSTSNGYEETLTAVEEDPNDDEFYRLETTEPQPVLESKSYDNVLPSANLSLFLTEEQILRLGASKTITRPTLGQLRPALGGYNSRKPTPGASAGNPQLEPYEATNLDVSWEWYYGDASYMSLAGFHKDTDNFITVDTLIEDILPGSAADGFLVSRPRNNRSAAVSGLEAALQHTHSSGLGVQVNYTYVKPEDEFDPLADAEDTFALVGLSDSANLVAFYETDRWQARVAYNWRDGYLQSQNGAQSQPEFQESYSQVDVSASYNLTDNFEIIFEGVNVTKETRRSYSIYRNRLLALQDTGARYSLGIRGSF